LEMADIAALIAPRPLVLEAGEKDPIFPIAATRESYSRLLEDWETEEGALGGGRPPELVITPEGHRFVGERSVTLLAGRLAGWAPPAPDQGPARRGHPPGPGAG